jgi:ferredoxin
MALAIDWTRCDGHGLCAELLPERISRDEWGYPLIRPTGPSGGGPAPPPDAAERRAVALCPALALRLTDR